MTKQLVKKQKNQVLVFVHGNEKIVTDSLLIASEFKKEHSFVLKKIVKVIKRNEKLSIGGVVFAPAEYLDKQKKPRKKYLLNRKAFLDIAMSFTGDRAAQLRDVFITAFEKLEQFYIDYHNDPSRIKARIEGKITRRIETDTVKQFVEYAIKQGSINAQRYYTNISKMENKALFFLEQKFKNIRNHLVTSQLRTIEMADRIVEKALLDGMEQEMDYHDIYFYAKDQVLAFVPLVGKTNVPLFAVPQRQQLTLF